MAKVVLLTINIFAIFIYNIFFGGDVTIEQRFPESINAGESFIIEIEITKEDRDGFAKWQQSLPEGFIATAVETAGATFSFKNQDVKIIWMSIPEEESFVISYEIKTDPQMQGNFDLSGQFSFIENNQRKDISSLTKSISVVNETPILAANPNPIENAEDTSSEIETPIIPIAAGVVTAEVAKDTATTVEKTIEDSNKESSVTIEGTVADNNGLIISREIVPITPSKYEVILTITKGELNSFGKIEDYLPPLYVASPAENMEGIFTFNNNVVKILWMTLPADEVLTVRYMMESTSDDLDSALIHGAFSYLEGDESKQLKLNPTKFANTFIPAIAEEIPELIVEETPEPIVAEAIVIAEIVEATKKEEELASEITNIPAPETDVAYRVQIAASKKEVNQQYFIDRHSISSTVNIEYHNSWYKYTIGGYNLYKEARDERNELWAADNKIDDAFVTAYNSGERISVQEALMISQQKWLK